MADTKPVTAPAADEATSRPALPTLPGASFDDLVLAQWNVDKISVNGRPTPEHMRDLVQARNAFEQSHGTIVGSFFGRVDYLAAVLTDTDEFFIDTTRSGTILSWPGLDDLLHRCQVLSIEARTVLDGDARRICMELIFTVVRYSLAAVDRFAWYTQLPTERALGSGASNVEDRMQTQRQAELMYARAATYQARVAQQLTRRRYTFGMLYGITAALAVLVAVVTLEAIQGRVMLWTDETYEMQPWRWGLATGGAGALGATVSVLQRLTAGSLILDPTASEEQAKLLGAARVFLGGVFGLALYCLLMAELLPIEVPSEPRTFFYYVLILAFLAGFSERFAQDALAITTRRFLPEAKEPGRPIEVGVPAPSAGRPDGVNGPSTQDDAGETGRTKRTD
jgi:hypothetical protein